MAEGWKFRTRRPNPDGGADLLGLVVVRVADQHGAILVASSKMPDAVLEVDSEASPELLEEYDMKPGQMLILMEGQ